jgi:hypothetical protein
MSEKTRKRLSDFARATIGGGKQILLSIETRTSTGRGSRFGSVGNLSLDEEEMRKLYEILQEYYEE